MKRVLLILAVSFLSACGGEEGGEKTYSGECVYISTTHTFHDPNQCALQGDALGCKSAELEDRSDADRIVIACEYSGCSEDFDCEAFRSL